MDMSPIANATPSVDAMPQPAVETDEDGFGFDDLLDIINPLQHLPIVGTIYRAITGDEIAKPAQIAGDTLYGGLLGFVGALGTIAFEEIAGDSVDNMLASLFDGNASPTDPYRAQRAYASAQALTQTEILP
jgi:hypothetical protein